MGIYCEINDCNDYDCGHANNCKNFNNIMLCGKFLQSLDEESNPSPTNVVVIPQPTKKDIEGGWMVNTDFIDEVCQEIDSTSDIEWDIGWEEVHAVLEALKRINMKKEIPDGK